VKKRLVVLLPGFNGDARQPLLVHVAGALGARGFRFRFPGLPKGRPSAGLVEEVAFLARRLPPRAAPIVVGRSFGGRVALRYAMTRRVSALVLLGFPVRPAGRPRPEDEAALLAVRVPTLIVQGDADDKGPLDVLRPLVAKNPMLSLLVLPGAGHAFGRHEGRAVALAKHFIAARGRLRRSGDR
jgi:predicted alpha/beta-hydrolase family hydrolase